MIGWIYCYLFHKADRINAGPSIIEDNIFAYEHHCLRCGNTIYERIIDMDGEIDRLEEDYEMFHNREGGYKGVPIE